MVEVPVRDVAKARSELVALAVGFECHMLGKVVVRFLKLLAGFMPLAPSYTSHTFQRNSRNLLFAMCLSSAECYGDVWKLASAMLGKVVTILTHPPYIQ
jgi:hypothetical protein